MHAVTKPFSALALTLTIAAGAACTGEISDSPTDNTPGGGSSATAGNGPGTGGSGTVLPQNCQPGMPSVTRAPLRRLTRFEYNNTVRDLLQDKSLPANVFPSEESGNGFGNDADAQAVVAALAEQYVNVSEKVALGATASDRIGALSPCATQVSE